MSEPRLFGGRYELGELIGYGGMAEVHRGRDLRLNREVAVKVLRADLARDQTFLIRFRREAHSAAGLNHPSIVSVYDTGEDVVPEGSDLPYIVMEFVEGRTLRDILRSEGRLPARRALEITADVCAALDFSHRNGIVHRDIKPANVMITPQGAVKVMDFGIARAVADQSSTVTQTANVIGTAQYLSPEQARGEAVDARSDVYSTGCLLYELLTGSPPFQGDSPVAVAYQHVRENPVLPSSRNPEVPRAADSIVMKSLAKNVANRYQSAAEMRQDIQRAIANQPVLAEAVMTDAERTQFIARTAPPPLAVQRRADDYGHEPLGQRRAWLIGVLVVVALLVVAGAAGWLIYHNRTKSTASSDVVVPVAAIGVSPAGAESLLKGLSLNPVNGSKTHGPCDDGKPGKKDFVCTLDPKPGVKVQKGETVTYHVYTPDFRVFPSLLGDPSKTAVEVLNGLGLKPHLVYSTSSTAAKGVVTQTVPTSGTPVAPGAIITLIVSVGPKSLPNVVGKDFAAAQVTLMNAGFKDVVAGPQHENTSDPTKVGTVFRVSPAPGGQYPLSTEITLTTYAYSAPPPPPVTTSSSCPPSSASSSPSSSGSPSGSASSSSSPSTSSSTSPSQSSSTTPSSPPPSSC